MLVSATECWSIFIHVAVVTVASTFPQWSARSSWLTHWAGVAERSERWAWWWCSESTGHVPMTLDVLGKEIVPPIILAVSHDACSSLLQNQSEIIRNLINAQKLSLSNDFTNKMLFYPHFWSHIESTKVLRFFTKRTSNLCFSFQEVSHSPMLSHLVVWIVWCGYSWWSNEPYSGESKFKFN